MRRQGIKKLLATYGIVTIPTSAVADVEETELGTLRITVGTNREDDFPMFVGEEVK